MQLFFRGGVKDEALWSDVPGEHEDLNMLWDGLRSMIHDVGDPDPPSDSSCKETETLLVSI